MGKLSQKKKFSERIRCAEGQRIYRRTRTCIKQAPVLVKVLITQPSPTLWDPVHCSPPGSSVHGILQAKILEWVAIPFSRGSSWPGVKPKSPACRQILYQLSQPGKPPCFKGLQEIGGPVLIPLEDQLKRWMHLPFIHPVPPRCRADSWRVWWPYFPHSPTRGYGRLRL